MDLDFTYAKPHIVIYAEIMFVMSVRQIGVMSNVLSNQWMRRPNLDCVRMLMFGVCVVECMFHVC